MVEWEVTAVAGAAAAAAEELVDGTCCCCMTGFVGELLPWARLFPALGLADDLLVFPGY